MGVCDSPKRIDNEAFVNRENPLQKLPKYIANVSKSLCKLECENLTASGFLLKLKKEGKEFFCIMTCEHVITREMIQQRKTMSFYYDSIEAKTQEIELNPEDSYKIS